MQSALPHLSAPSKKRTVTAKTTESPIIYIGSDGRLNVLVRPRKEAVIHKSRVVLQDESVRPSPFASCLTPDVRHQQVRLNRRHFVKLGVLDRRGQQRSLSDERLGVQSPMAGVGSSFSD